MESSDIAVFIFDLGQSAGIEIEMAKATDAADVRGDESGVGGEDGIPGGRKAPQWFAEIVWYGVINKLGLESGSARFIDHRLVYPVSSDK